MYLWIIAGYVAAAVAGSGLAALVSQAKQGRKIRKKGGKKKKP